MSNSCMGVHAYRRWLVAGGGHAGCILDAAETFRAAFMLF